jgi:hypothetical protein
MRKFLSLLLIFICVISLAQNKANVKALQQFSTQLSANAKENHKQTMELAKAKGWELIKHGKNTQDFAMLTGINRFGEPIYLSVDNAYDAAPTTGVTKLWSGGSMGLNLSGSLNFMKGKVAVWDGGPTLTTHQEFGGKIQWKDTSTTVPISDHATHVSGTIAAIGVDASAKGMAYGLQQLIDYDFYNAIQK